MRIRWTKADGRGKPDTLACFRENGTSTYTRLTPYFPLHDLLHYAVETTLGYDMAFWGLIAQGWDFDRFAEKDSETGRLANALPATALLAENLVGVLQLTESGSVSSDPDELHHFLSEQWDRLPAEITPDTLGAIITRFTKLSQQWEQLPPAGAMELSFPLPGNGGGER